MNPSLDFPVDSFGAIVLYCFIGAVPHIYGRASPFCVLPENTEQNGKEKSYKQLKTSERKSFMNEKGFNSPLTLSEFFRTGKMDNDFIVSDKYITGICLMYPERSAQEHEYMIREKSIVELDDRGLSVCVQEAKDLACTAAILHLQAGNVSALPVKTAPHPQSKHISEVSVITTQKSVKEPPALPKSEESSPTVESETSTTSLQNAVLPTENHTDTLISGAHDDDEDIGTAVRVAFDDLRPASSLIPQDSNDGDDDDEANQYEKARNTIITVCGKLHECFQWPAGKILDEKPIYIVELSQRYDGPRTEEKSALRTLYTEALRRCNAAA